MVIGVVALNFGNIASILNMLNTIGYQHKLIRTPLDLTPEVTKIIFPGVGHFDYAMNALKKSGLDERIKQLSIEEKTPILGICLGMQLLLENSEESGSDGLGLIPGSVVKIESATNGPIRLPHVGWRWFVRDKTSKLYPSLESNLRFYFTHTFVARPLDENIITSKIEYGSQLCSSFEHNNILGVQFHPEKSHRFGFELFRNFCQL